MQRSFLQYQLQFPATQQANLVEMSQELLTPQSRSYFYTYFGPQSSSRADTKAYHIDLHIYIYIHMCI